MEPRKRLMLWLTVMIGAAAIALPAAAASETGSPPSIEAENRTGGQYGESHAWRNGTVSIEAGGSVSISNPTAVAHGVAWVGGGPMPSCTSGVPVGTAGTQWSGTCTFAQPGTYTFYCTVHGAAMSGTVTVTAPPQPAPTTPPITPTIAPGGGPTGSSSPTPPESAAGAPSPLAGDAASAVKVAGLQRGSSVRGSLLVAAAGAGGRLEVRLQAAGAALARSGPGRLVAIGREVRSHLPAGKVGFAVVVDAAGRRALRARRHLAVSVRIVLAPRQGAPLTLRRAVTLRA